MGRPLIVLLVEDNPVSRRLAYEILHRRGHSVVQAGDVDEARSRLGEGVPDVVVLDIQIPGGGGELLLAEIRACPRVSHVPVIAVTALAQSEDRARLLSIGCDAYMSKPIDIIEFGSLVESHGYRPRPES